MKLLRKVTIWLFAIFAAECIGIFIYITMAGAKEGEGTAPFGTPERIFLIVFFLTVGCCIAIYGILLIWMLRLYRQKRTLGILLREYLLCVVFLLVLRLGLNVFRNENTEAAQFAFQVFVFPLFLFWPRINTCVKENTNDKIIRRG